MTIKEQIDLAEQLASMAIDESNSDRIALHVNAAGKGWNAARHAAVAVLSHVAGESFASTGDILDALDEATDKLDKDHLLSRFNDLVLKAYPLHVKAEEKAAYQTKSLRRTLLKIRDELIPLAKSITGSPLTWRRKSHGRY